MLETDPVEDIDAPYMTPLVAQRLTAAGYKTVGDLQDATQADLADALDDDLVAAQLTARLRDIGHDPENEDGLLILDTQLTQDSPLGGTACLSTTESIPSGSGRAPYNPSVLEAWANELSDIEGYVEVGVGYVRTDPDNRLEGDPETVLALYAVVPDSDVVAFAAPLDRPDDEDEDGAEYEVTVRTADVELGPGTSGSLATNLDYDYLFDGPFDATEVPPSSMPDDFGEFEFPYAANEDDDK